MWSDLRKHTANFATAVLTGLDAEGYPFSVRCAPIFDDEAQVVRLDSLVGARFKAGQANVLFHQHNEQLWDLKMIQVLGVLERAGENWVFRPTRLLLGGGISPWHDLMMIVRGRRTAREYLAKRGLTRPRIPWDRIRSFYPKQPQSAPTSRAKKVV